MLNHLFLTHPQSNRFWLILFLTITLLGSTSCKRKKKLAAEMARQEALAEAEAAEEERMRELDRVRDQLEAMINNPAGSYDDLRDKERELMQIKYQNYDDPQIQSLIKQAEYALQSERETLDNQENEGKQEAAAVTMKDQLLDRFQSVANAGSPSLANIRIQDALEMFSSPNAPVLIVISEVRGRKEYDRPTTIKRYLEYLKDQGKNPDEIYDVVMDRNGRIKELELIKR